MKTIQNLPRFERLLREYLNSRLRDMLPVRDDATFELLMPTRDDIIRGCLFCIDHRLPHFPQALLEPGFDVTGYATCVLARSMGMEFGPAWRKLGLDCDHHHRHGFRATQFAIEDRNKKSVNPTKTYNLLWVTAASFISRYTE